MMSVDRETAIFAGGCFWCVASAFDGQKGVLEVASGYVGGHVENPSYEQVCSGTTGHAEAVRITYDPSRISFQDLMAIFFQQIDPTDPSGSFVDRGSQYRSAIFFQTPEQERQARDMVSCLNGSGIFDRPVATQVVRASAFYSAEDYHQGFHTKNPVRYNFYRVGSGRDAFIKQFWRNGNSRIFDQAPTGPQAAPDQATEDSFNSEEVRSGPVRSGPEV